jgi:hypothetical protein
VESKSLVFVKIECGVEKHLGRNCNLVFVQHPVVQRSKDIWKADDLVHTIPQSGEYKGRRERLNTELRKEFKEFQSQVFSSNLKSAATAIATTQTHSN